MILFTFSVLVQTQTPCLLDLKTPGNVSRGVEKFPPPLLDYRVQGRMTHLLTSAIWSNVGHLIILSNSTMLSGEILGCGFKVRQHVLLNIQRLAPEVCLMYFSKINFY